MLFSQDRRERFHQREALPPGIFLNLISHWGSSFLGFAHNYPSFLMFAQIFSEFSPLLCLHFLKGWIFSFHPLFFLLNFFLLTSFCELCRISPLQILELFSYSSLLFTLISSPLTPCLLFFLPLSKPSSLLPSSLLLLLPPSPPPFVASSNCVDPPSLPPFFL